jgi:hypothetical protein
MHACNYCDAGCNLVRPVACNDPASDRTAVTKLTQEYWSATQVRVNHPLTNIPCVATAHQHSVCGHRSPAFRVWPPLTSIPCVATAHQHSVCGHRSPAFRVWPPLTNIPCVATAHQHSVCGHRSPAFRVWPPFVCLHFASPSLCTALTLHRLHFASPSLCIAFTLHRLNFRRQSILTGWIL